MLTVPARRLSVGLKRQLGHRPRGLARVSCPGPHVLQTWVLVTEETSVPFEAAACTHVGSEMARRHTTVVRECLIQTGHWQIDSPAADQPGGVCVCPRWGLACCSIARFPVALCPSDMKKHTSHPFSVLMRFPATIWSFWAMRQRGVHGAENRAPLRTGPVRLTEGDPLSSLTQNLSCFTYEISYLDLGCVEGPGELGYAMTSWVSLHLIYKQHLYKLQPETGIQ